jgi:predicted DNA-binding transcriptional regulator AlpA
MEGKPRIWGLVIRSPTNVPSYPATRYGDTPADDSDDYFLTATGNASDMWLWRRLRDDSKFPRPIEIRRRRYWKLSELIMWERACARTT